MATELQMARNGSGTYATPNSFSSGSTISSSAMNANFTDVASEITNSLPRDGQAAMTGQLKAIAGTQAAPGITYGTDTSTGIRRSATGTQRIVASGTDVVEIGTTGLTMQSGMTITDANSVVVVGMPTGVILPYGATTAPTGWVRANAKTIGNASSSATERANADTANLFSFLWTNYDDTRCPVSGGRGASAAADYAANKTIALPDLRGRSLFGLDDMGNSAASRLGSVVTSSTTNGASGGAETVTLAQANLPNVTLTTDSQGDHTHLLVSNTGAQSSLDATNYIDLARDYGGSSPFNYTMGSRAGTPTSGKSSTNGAHTHTTSSLNGGVAQTAVGNMPPAFLTTFIIKL